MITKEQYFAAKKKYPENKFSKFMVMTFLRSTTYNIYKKIIIGEFLTSNLLAAILLVNNIKTLAIIFAIVGNGIFAIFGISLLVASFIDMYRAKKVCTELNINIDDLNNLEIQYNS
jgi:hypothetical protein